MPEEFDARQAFARLVDVLDAHTTYFASIDRRLEAQEATLVAVVEGLTDQGTHLHLASLDHKFDLLLEESRRVIERLDRLNESIVRGFTDAADRDGELRRRVEALEAEVAALKTRAAD
jgi:cell division protein FtsB